MAKWNYKLHTLNGLLINHMDIDITSIQVHFLIDFIHFTFSIYRQYTNFLYFYCVFYFCCFKASVERFDEGKIVRVSFVVNGKANSTRASIRYRETQKKKTAWEYRTVTSTELSQGFYVIEDLDPEKIYEFQVVWYVGKKEQITDAGKGT